MRAIAYVDGFNLYFRALKATPYKWLDVGKLLQFEFPDDEIATIRYFTAPIKGRATDPDKPRRQEVYLRALRTIDRLDIIKGKYQSYEEEMRVVKPKAGCPDPVVVWNTEEKGSDVNLASWMLIDAFDGQLEKAIVISNDSDLLMPLKQLRNRFGLHVAVDSPDRLQPNLELKAVATTFKEISPGTLKVSQFPDELKDRNGSTLRKPEAWNVAETWRDALQEVREQLPPA